LRAYFEDNELIAETFFDGRELSLEMMRQDGRTVIAVEQERTVMEFTGRTVLERGYASPAITMSATELAAARALTDRVLDELGLDTGPYHVELRIGPAGHPEIIEINPRGGGGFLVESVRLQFDRSLGDDWISTLLREPLPVPGARTCGTYCQNQWLAEERQVLGVRKDESLPAPDGYAEAFQIGVRGRADREEPGVRAMWRTDLADHAATVAALVPTEYASIVYARGRSGAPLFIVLEPTNHLYQVIEAAARRGYDVVVFNTLPLPAAGPYERCRDGIAEIHRMSSWQDVDSCLARILAVCGDSPVAGTYAGQEITLEIDARLQEHFGLPGKDAATVRGLLDKVTTRRRLAQAGLTKLLTFTESEVDGWTQWPLPGEALYFKPVRGAASAFVRRCTTLAEVRAAIDIWRSADKAALPVLGDHLTSHGGGFFLEQEARGELLSAEGYVYGDEYHLIGLLSRAVLAKDPAVEMGITYPFDHPRRAEIADLMSSVHKALGVGYGLTHVELMVPADGDIELVELNLRFAGADALTTMNVAYGCRLEDELVALAVGAAPDFDRPTLGYACMHALLAPVGATRLESVELPVPDLPFVKHLKVPGSDLVSTDQQIDWVAVFVVFGETYAEAFGRAQDIRRRTRINGVELGLDPNNVVIGH
jgi:biotin carboxylase